MFFSICYFGGQFFFFLFLRFFSVSVLGVCVSVWFGCVVCVCVCVCGVCVRVGGCVREKNKEKKTNSKTQKIQ